MKVLFFYIADKTHGKLHVSRGRRVSRVNGNTFQTESYYIKCEKQEILKRF